MKKHGGTPMEKYIKYRDLIDDLLQMSVLFGEDGMVTYINKAAREQLQFDNKTDRVHISDIFPNEFERTATGFKYAYEFGSDIHDMMAYRKNKTCFRTETKIVVDSYEGLVYLCMIRDVSKSDFLEKEILRVTKEAEEAMKVKSEFVANVTHELRTPVNGILGNVRELISKEENKETLKGLSIIERCCNDMNGIINNILDFSKLEAGKFTLEPRRFCFRNMMDYVKANHINKITEKGLEFFMTISPDIPEDIISDELRISQVLNNLLSNACKFTSFGKITVEVVRTTQLGSKAELFFIVMDTGVGIDQSAQDKLFKSFSQVDATISRKYGGTGLGLNICKQLVEMMGGSISVNSEKNKGSMFSFSIWVDIPDDEVAELTGTEPDIAMHKAMLIAREMYENEQVDESRIYGSEKNKEELNKNISKLILSIEMENWEKAEMFVNVIRELTEEAPREMKTLALKLKMAVQKENTEKALESCETFGELL
ncbi:MAG: hypothetical protein IJW18_05300 [Lachnospiraceae bacterium]|nr:hypothetical protein [Lachnospiraceae bacterium]